MRRRFFPTLIIFTLLILVNLYMTLKVIAKEQRNAQMSMVLDEIDSSALGQNQFGTPSGPSNSGVEADVQLADGRVANLKAFFRKHNSPLYDHAEMIVKVSDKYEFDYRLLPAIAMQESTLCRAIPNDSHNCWGWGIYGNKITRFSSYDEAIETVAKGLKKNYIDKGLVTATQIMEVYTPSSNGSWAKAVNSVMRYLE